MPGTKDRRRRRRRRWRIPRRPGRLPRGTRRRTHAQRLRWSRPRSSLLNCWGRGRGCQKRVFVGMFVFVTISPIICRATDAGDNGEAHRRPVLYVKLTPCSVLIHMNRCPIQRRKLLTLYKGNVLKVELQSQHFVKVPLLLSPIWGGGALLCISLRGSLSTSPPNNCKKTGQSKRNLNLSGFCYLKHFSPCEPQSIWKLRYPCNSLACNL